MENNNEISNTEVIHVIEAMSNNFEMKYYEKNGYYREFNRYFKHEETGGCYILAQALKKVFEAGDLLYNDRHVVYCLNNQMYDAEYEVDDVELSRCGKQKFKLLENEQDIQSCESHFVPIDSDSARRDQEELLEFLITVGKRARESYATYYGGHKK